MHGALVVGRRRAWYDGSSVLFCLHGSPFVYFFFLFFFWVFVGGWGLGPHLPTILLLASCGMREVCLGFCISTHVIWRSLVKPNTSGAAHQHREARRPDMPNPKRLMVMDALNVSTHNQGTNRGYQRTSSSINWPGRPSTNFNAKGAACVAPEHFTFVNQLLTGLILPTNRRAR